MSTTVVEGPCEHGSDRGPGLFARTFMQADGSESPPVVTNLRLAGNGRKRGSALINLATALLLVLAVALYVVSISAQWKYVFDVKHDNVVAWIEAASLDGGMAIFTLLALGLSRAGQAARIERLFVVICALGSAAMNYAAADTGSLRSALAYTVPPIFLAAVVDRTVSVIRRHYLGDDDASAWSHLGRVGLYTARFVVAPASTIAGGRRALLAAAPVPAKPVAEIPATPEPKPVGPPALLFRQLGPVVALPTAERSAVATPTRKASRPRATANAPRRRSPSGQTKSKAFLDLVEREVGPLAVLPVDQCYATAKLYAPKVGLHEGSARTVLRKAIIAAGGAQ